MILVDKEETCQFDKDWVLIKEHRFYEEEEGYPRIGNHPQWLSIDLSPKRDGGWDVHIERYETFEERGMENTAWKNAVVTVDPATGGTIRVGDLVGIDGDMIGVAISGSNPCGEVLIATDSAIMKLEIPEEESEPQAWLDKELERIRIAI